jgi:predicted acylesterase/phospholipase RssA
MSTKIRLVLQGGGARLVNLLAAIEVIASLQAKGEIEVTRIVGTSAGAVAGAILALGGNVGAVKATLKGIPFSQLFPPRGTKEILFRLVRNKPVWDIEGLRTALEQFIPSTRVFSALKIPLTVVSADLADRMRVDYSTENHADKSVLNAVVDSAAVPFAFRIWNRQHGSIMIDGGLCENLPVGSIGGDDKDGPVIAIGFDKPIGPSPTSLKDFTLGLMDLAISNSEARARALLPKEQVLLLPAKIGTFDFETAIKEGLGDQYDLVQLTVEQFIKQAAREFQRRELEKQKKASEAASLADSASRAVKGNVNILTNLDAWNHPDALSRELMQGLGNVYYKQHSKRKVQYTEASYVITANSFLGDDPMKLKDITVIEARMHTLDEPVFCLGFAVTRPPGSQFSGMMEYRFWDSADQPLNVICLPMLKPGEQPEHRRICVFFDPPLPPKSGPYRIQLVDEPLNILPMLRRGEFNKVGFMIPRAKEPYTINLVVHLPKEFGEPLMQRPDESPDGRPMTKTELKPFITPKGFCTVGWTGANLSPEMVFGVNLKLNKPKT